MLWMALAFAGDEEKSAWSVSATDDLEMRYWVRDQRLADPSDVPVFNYFEQVNRLNVKVAKGPWTFKTQIDQVALLANRYYLDDVLYVERPLFTPELKLTPFGRDTDLYANIEKVSLSYEASDLSLELGDHYAAFGRGIALNLNRNVDIDLDTSIQGMKVVARPGTWDLTALMGQLNRQQVFQDNPNINLRGDFRHTVFGLRAEKFGWGPANVAAHLVGYDFVGEPGFEAGFTEAVGPDVLIGGGSVELTGVGGVDWFLEGDVFDYTTERLAGPDTPLGYAVYGSATFYPGKTVWLVEAKRYANTNQVNSILAPELYQVAIAPTLEYERAITEDSAASVGSEDIWGGRVRVDWSLRPGMFVPYAAVGVFRDLDTGGLHFNEVPETTIHPMVGADWLPGDGAILLNAGYRRDIRDEREAGVDQQFHGDVTLNFPLFAGLQGNVNIGAEYFDWGVNPIQQDSYTEVETSWTASKGPVAFTWFTDFSSNPLINSTGNITETLYMAGELQLKPAPAITVKAFYGAYKSGIRCSGGQCRLLPGFEGARASIVASF